MEIVVDGSQVVDMPSFLAGVAKSLGVDNEDADRLVGWDFHSFTDFLHGGIVGEAPYIIRVKDADEMFAAFDQNGMVNYCASMIEVIDRGGRGLARPESRPWFVARQQEAASGKGETLLNALFEVIESAPASLTLLGRDGRVIAQVDGRIP